MDRLKGKVAIVTGSTSGIGIGIARLFAAEGAKVVICGRREAKGQEVVDSIVAEGGEASYHFMDITDVSSTDKLIADTYEKYGKIDILVNNAANVALKDGRVDELTLEEFDAVVTTDLGGTFNMIKEVLPVLMKNEKGGNIINIGSMASAGGDLGTIAYACAKAGVDKLTEYVACMYGPSGIRCNCVRPGLIVTPQNESRIPEVLKDIFLSNILGKRYGNPEDIGHLCVYLASDEAEYMNGQVLTCDGGLNSHTPTVAQFRQLSGRTW
ncbi:MAG: SDR family NAD(P)-dependent oxidoreductase [Frisingicoccus sp.]|uniref:SDR family NAD(P)-dependent oxidoreductase n=1 Tax=Frisingicoccus sp. TaxID=1918627 RepID=UPI00261FA186|nr:SDR family oxidoreductase [Frisingicoccus sp.]MDD6232413.1 SDR family NAD(P)-dependent oxidoreductase [Frisingicoccus sp.]